MSRILRSPVRGPVTVTVRLLEEIEAVTAADCELPPSVIAPLAARAEAARSSPPAADPALEEDIETALGRYGGVLHLDEIHAIQRLRGWHRTRHGNITVDAYWLAETRNVLDTLTFDGEECDQVLGEYGLDRVTAGPGVTPAYDGFARERARILQALAETGSCGVCAFCRELRLRDECDTILDNAGYDGGHCYRAYALPRTGAGE